MERLEYPMKLPYGTELILDIHECITKFDRKTIAEFMRLLCKKLKMKRADLHFWDYEDPEEKEAAPDHLAGTSAIQFITTSNVTIHTLDKLHVVYLNIFTCAELNPKTVEKFCHEYWQGTIVNSQLIERK